MRPPPRREGRQIFADELTRFADRDGDARLAEIVARVTAPLTVGVRGRRGVGVSTVEDALAGAGLEIAESGDVTVVVTAEVLKPEDEALLAELNRAGRPTLVVLNKADLAGSGPGGPIATARHRSRRLQELAGVPVTPMIALLSRPVLPEPLVEALRLLAAEPADLSSVDAFVSVPHRVDGPVRASC